MGRLTKRAKRAKADEARNRAGKGKRSKAQAPTAGAIAMAAT